MARLPIDLMTATDRANLPSARVVTEKATAADFGGQIGAAVQGLAEAGQQLAAKVQANAKRVQEFSYEKQFSELQEQDNVAYEQKMRGISGNADGHWQSAREETKARFDNWLQALPEQARAEYAARAQQFQGRRTAQAFQDQFRQQDTNTRQALTEEQRRAGLAVQQSPQSYEDFVKAQEALIDKSTLTPAEKVQRKTEVRNALAFTAEQARVQQNPAGVVAEGVGGSYRDKVRAKESSGNDGATSSNSSAVGRYQFLEGTWNAFAGKAGVPPVTAENRGTKNDPRLNGEWQEKALDQYIVASTAALTSNRLPVTDANLYLLHFMGQGGGVKFLRALQENAGASAANMFPTEANANASIFYSGRTRDPRTVGEVYALLTRGLNGSGVTPSAARSPSSQALSAEQNAQIQEAARRKIVADAEQAAAAREADLSARRNQTYLDLKEGPNPEAAYREARRSGVLSSFDDIQKAEGIMRARDKDDADFRTGLSLVEGGRAVANPYNKDHRDGVSALYERGVKNGADPAALAASVFDRTGIVPQQFATALRGAMASEDAGRVGAALMAAANMLRQNPNAFAGVDGGSDLEKSAFEFRRLTENRQMSTEQAAQRVISDARNPAMLDPVKQEQMAQFRKTALTQEKIDSRLQSKFASGYLGFGAPALPTGPQRTAIASIYSEFAEEGFQQFRDPEKALDFADLRVQQQFGVQNGVLTRFPPSKTGLPKLPGASDGYAWINAQAADVVKDRLGIVVDPSQIVLMPIERDGVSTSAAFRGNPMTVKRSDGKPGQETSFRSVPYMIQVIPKTVDQEIQTVYGAFFPDVETYVEKQNKGIAAANAAGRATDLTAYDQLGIPYAIPPHAAKMLDTPEQLARRTKAEQDAVLRAAQEAERAAQAQTKSRLGEFNRNVDTLRALDARRKQGASQ